MDEEFRTLVAELGLLHRVTTQRHAVCGSEMLQNLCLGQCLCTAVAPAADA